MNNIDIEMVLEELKVCGVDKYDIETAMMRGIKNTFKPEIYLTDGQVVQTETIASSVKATRAALVERFDTWDDAVSFHKFKSTCESIYLQDDEKGGMCIKRGVQGYSSDYYPLIKLLRYAVLNKFDDTGEEVNDLTDTLRNTTGYGFSYLEACEFKVFDINIRCYKNGKCIIKGLSEEQRARIVDGFALYNKYSVRY